MPMLRRAPFVWLVLALGLLAGCTSEPPRFQPVSPIPAGQGVVYLYRPPLPLGEGPPGTVIANKRPVVQLTPGGYFPYTGRPGPVYLQLVTSDPYRTLVSRGMIRVEAGREKYLKVTKVGDRLKFTPMFPEPARPEIAACHLLDAAVPEMPAIASSVAASPAAPPPYPVRRSYPRPAPAPVEPRRVQGKFSFEAERIAIENGCTTPTGVRPTGYLVEQTENLGVYDVVCGSEHMSVGCQFQYCELLR